MTEVATNGATEPVAPAHIADDGAKVGQPQGDSLEQRIQSDPAFALEQYKKVKGESTKLYQAQKKYEAIQKIADQLGGAEVAAQLIQEYAALAQTPDVARIREHYRIHGTLPTTTSTRTDDTVDDEYKDPQQVKIEALERELADIRSSLSQTRGAIGKQGMMSMLERLKGEFPDGFDEHILPKLEANVSDLERTPQGREVLASLKYEQLRAIAGTAIAENLDAIAELRHARVLEQKKRAATGAPASTMSTGREVSTVKRLSSASEVLAEYRARFGDNFA